jgi:hypothetical protein
MFNTSKLYKTNYYNRTNLSSVSSILNSELYY